MDPQLFERLVHEEMERQLRAVRQEMETVGEGAADLADRGELDRRFEVPQEKNALAPVSGQENRHETVPGQRTEHPHDAGTSYPDIKREQRTNPVHVLQETQNTLETPRGFGRGINTLGSIATTTELQRQRQLALDKKLEYQRDLDIQLAEKRNRMAHERLDTGREERGPAASPPEPPTSVLPLGPREEDKQTERERQRKKQEEYARMLQEQVAERERQKQKEKEEEELFERRYGSPRDQTSPLPLHSGHHATDLQTPHQGRLRVEELSSQPSVSGGEHEPIQSNNRFQFANLNAEEQENFVRKQMLQQQAQHSLREQISEKNRRAEELRRIQAEQEVAEEERIRREIRELEVSRVAGYRTPDEMTQHHQQNSSYSNTQLSSGLAPSGAMNQSRLQSYELQQQQEQQQQQRQFPMNGPEKATTTDMEEGSSYLNGTESFRSSRGEPGSYTSPPYPGRLHKPGDQSSTSLPHEMGLQQDDAAIRALASDLEIKRDQVIEMKRQREALERELEMQRVEIRKLKEHQLRLQSRSALQSEHASDSPGLPLASNIAITERHHAAHSSSWARQDQVASRRPMSMNDNNGFDLSGPSRFENSMPSKSTFVGVRAPLSARFSALSFGHEFNEEEDDNRVRISDEFSRREHQAELPAYSRQQQLSSKHLARERPLLDPRASVEPTFSPPSQKALEREDLESELDEENLVECSLPCASRYFVYVSQQYNEGEEDDEGDGEDDDEESGDGDGDRDEDQVGGEDGGDDDRNEAFIEAQSNREHMVDTTQYNDDFSRKSASGGSAGFVRLKSPLNNTDLVWDEGESSAELLFQAASGHSPIAGSRAQRKIRPRRSRRFAASSSFRTNEQSFTTSKLDDELGSEELNIDDDNSALLSDLEQSRVRTAQAARMALQRASAHSEDEDSSRNGRKAAIPRISADPSSPKSLGLSTSMLDRGTGRNSVPDLISIAGSVATPSSSSSMSSGGQNTMDQKLSFEETDTEVPTASSTKRQPFQVHRNEQAHARAQAATRQDRKKAGDDASGRKRGARQVLQKSTSGDESDTSYDDDDFSE